MASWLYESLKSRNCRSFTLIRITGAGFDADLQIHRPTGAKIEIHLTAAKKKLSLASRRSILDREIP
jgi:hypothetical protein